MDEMEEVKRRRVSNEDLEIQVAQVREELKESTDIREGFQLQVMSRFDKIDLNGSADILREFGRFLKENPGFLIKAKENIDSIEEKAIVVLYFKKKFAWFKRPKSIFGGIILLLASGAAYALGNSWVASLNLFAQHHIK